MPKYGSSSVLYMIGGRSLLGVQPKTLTYQRMAKREDTTGLGDTTMAVTPTGVSTTAIEHGGAFFDTTSLHTVLSDVADSPQEASDVLCAVFGGNTLGQPMIGFGGVYKGSYEVICETGNLTKANTRFLLNGAIGDGVILKTLAAITADTNGTGVDGGGSTTNANGAAWLQCTAFSGFSGAVITVEDSADNATGWATIATFTTVASAPTAERKAITGAIRRYTRYVVDVTGSGSITFFVGLNRT